MHKDILFCDIDGCITPQRKTRIEYNGELILAKEYNDHDSNIINYLKDRLVFISADKRVNKTWAESKGIKFLYAPGKTKYGTIMDFWLRGELKDRTDMPGGNYFYLGDSLPDYECLVSAKIAFTPLDLCPILARKLRDCKNHRILSAKGGEGLLGLIVLELQRDYGIWTDLVF